MYNLSACVMYKNMNATIRLDDDAVFITIADKEHNSVSLTLNPCQVLTLAKYLYAALSEIKLEDIYKSELFGNLSVHIETENITAEDFQIPDGCHDNEFFYYDYNDDELIAAND